MSECPNKRINQRYMHYENVRNKFAKDVGFSYKRSFEDRSLTPGQIRQPGE